MFSEVCPYEGKVARVRFAELWGTIGRNGLFVVQPTYYGIDSYSPDSLAVVVLNEKSHLINAKGERVGNVLYDRIEYADYGYKILLDGNYGTMNTKGEVMVEPKFDVMEALDRWRGLEQICVDGKWGILKDGHEILALSFEKRIVLLQQGTSGHPDLYLVDQKGRKGIVTSYGQFVVPCIYDEITISSSGQYYVTRVGDRYGAISLKMDELIAPILESKPFIGEDIFKVYDNGAFYAVNYKGTVPFKDCSDLFNVFRPDDYMSTTSIPEWSKHILIEQNLLDRQEDIDQASIVLDVLKKHGYDLNAVEADESFPDGYDMKIPLSSCESYGIAEGGMFVKTSGVLADYESGHYNMLFKATSRSGESLFVVSESSTGSSFVAQEGELIPLQPIFENFNITEFTAFEPKDFALMSDGSTMIRFAFHGLDSETHAIIKFNIDEMSSVSCHKFEQIDDYRLIASEFGGFYATTSKVLLSDSESPLRRFDRNGHFDWEYRPAYGERLYAIDETESYIYLCGSTTSSSMTGQETPVIVQLDKRGQKVNSMVVDVEKARFTGVICKDYLLYAKITYVDGKSPDSDYLPYFSLDDMGDNFGVKVKCVWEPWGTGLLGGCGLVSDSSTWLHAPVLEPDDMCAEFAWEFSGFTSDNLIVRHMGKYGLVSRYGDIIIETKFDFLEMLQNQSFVKATIDGKTGILDVSGKVVVPMEYDYVGRMSEDMIVVCKDGKFGCFDKDGSLVVPLEYDEIREYAGGMARISYKGKFGFIDKKGEMVVAPFSDEVENFSEGCTLVTIKNKVGFVNLDGEWLTVPMFDAGGSFSGGYAYLSQAGKYGYIDKSGEFVIPMVYSSATEFDLSTGLACVAKNGKWGVIDTNGKEIISFDFDKVELCEDGIVYVVKDGKCGLYDQNGAEIYPVVCDSIDIDENNRIFRNSVASGRLNGQRVKIDKNGNTIYQYSMLSDL